MKWLEALMFIYAWAVLLVFFWFLLDFDIMWR
jgi:hypothetical protein